MLNIVGAIIIVLLLTGLFVGIKNGVLKTSVTLVGIVLVFVLSYYMKNPIALIFYKYAPFFNFGILKDASVANILLYEFISFLICVIVLSVVLSVILKITKVIEKVFNATVVLGLISKLLGAVLGCLVSYSLIFVILFILNMPFISIPYLKESKVASFILENTPILSTVSENTVSVAKEFYNLKDIYDDAEDKDELNYELLDFMLDKKVINVESAQMLVSKKKLNIKNINTLIDKYEEEQ